jgi:hypothetical protein
VIILGVGFGALKSLRDANIRITLIDKHDYHAFQPLLYEVATEDDALTSRFSHSRSAASLSECHVHQAVTRNPVVLVSNASDSGWRVRAAETLAASSWVGAQTTISSGNG